MRLERRLAGLAAVLALTTALGVVRAQERAPDSTEQDTDDGAASRGAVSATVAADSAAEAVSASHSAAELQAAPAIRMQELVRRDVQFVEVDREQFNAVLQGTARLQAALSQAAAVPAPRAQAVLRANAASEALLVRAMANQRIGTEDLESARQVEKQLAVAYWDVAPVSLNTRQLGYVAQDRFEKLLRASATNLTVARLARSQPGFTDLLGRGRSRAEALTTTDDDDASPHFAALVASVDRFSNRLQTGALDLSDVQVLGLFESAVEDFGQMKTISLSLETPIRVEVHTLLDGAPNPGHLVRYELQLDYEIDSPQNLSFDRVSTPAQHQLGPFHYYLWAEKGGRRSSDPRLVNLGEPLQPERTIDLVVSEAAEPEVPAGEPEEEASGEGDTDGGESDQGASEEASEAPDDAEDSGEPPP